MRIAFLGLGIMGSRMAANLRKAGFDVTVWNRTRARAEELGEPVADTPRAAAEGVDVVITMVVDAPDVEDVLFAPDGAAEGLRAGALAIDMSTIAPSAAKRIAARLAERDIAFVEAPVSGSKPKAEDGTLTIMVGGSPEDVAVAQPLFEVMGDVVVHAGPVGHGQTIKVVNNAVAAANANTLAQALLVGAAAGVDLDALTQVMGAGSGGSTMLALKAGPMRAHDWTTLFKLEHMLKDVRLALEEAEAAGAPFPAAAAARRVLVAAEAAGLGEADFAALVEPLERDAGHRLS